MYFTAVLFCVYTHRFLCTSKPIRKNAMYNLMCWLYTVRYGNIHVHCYDMEEFTSRFFCLQRKHLAFWILLNKSFQKEVLLAPRPTPSLGGHPLSSVRECLFNIFAATRPYWRAFLHSQPEDAPCCGDGPT